MVLGRRDPSCNSLEATWREGGREEERGREEGGGKKEGGRREGGGREEGRRRSETFSIAAETHTPSNILLYRELK